MNYKILNRSALGRRASRTDDPRHIYYVAMLESSTFDGYVKNIRGEVPVYPVTYNGGREAISPHREFRYALKYRRWIEPVQAESGKPINENDLRGSFEWEVAEFRSMSSAQRKTCLDAAPTRPECMMVTRVVFKRSACVVAEVLERAAGKCERCNAPAPFIRPDDGEPYLEVHHKIPLADDGDDTVENAIALCPIAIVGCITG
ncbi:HNH endonuclease [Burkholderia multivorans]|uniref:HNH endonuclease n=1 Tax=Burkholderia multivorans TaxID=87883 RepID=UPI0021C0462F|nr:HNH endonuclease signature motif containing protein [Burkholderia multivorans]